MDKLTGRQSGKNVIAEFFKQTFRRHGGGEYSELFTRGMHPANKESLNKKYPWAYVRLFTVLFVMFAIFLLIIRFTSNEIFVPTVTLLSAVCFNLSFLLLLFELYPKKDLSFTAVLLALLIGGAGANIFAQILFSIFSPANLWLHAVYSGFFEELAKAAMVVLIIVASRKHSPLAGFVLGAAVGCGFSITEDMGYIFVQANEMPFVNLTTLIELSIARGFSAVCTHTLWTAAIGWAYCHFSKRFVNIFVYLITLLSCGLHICWDLPLGSLAMGCIYAACATIALTECVLVVFFERRKVFKNYVLPADALYKNESMVSEIWEQVEQENLARQSLDKKDPQYWRYWGHFTLALAAFLMAVTGVLYCSIPFRETYGTQTFRDSESFKSFMQNGLEFEYNENRSYDPNVASYPSGEYVVQYETGDDGLNYSYMYLPKHDPYDPSGETTYYYPYAVSVIIDDIAYFREDVYNDGMLYASFFRLTDSVTGYNFQSDGDITVFIYNPGYERDLSEWRYLALFCTFAGIAGAGVVCYISLVIKSWRIKKLCSTENVSSAE